MKISSFYKTSENKKLKETKQNKNYRPCLTILRKPFCFNGLYYLFLELLQSHSKTELEDPRSLCPQPYPDTREHSPYAVTAGHGGKGALS